MARRLSFVGPEGVGAFAMAAVDIPCWDLAAQVHKVPLSTACSATKAGRCRSTCRATASASIPTC
jgi:L-alanine-DL-glutamate epimerase-like enolase superfamily enzyme